MAVCPICRGTKKCQKCKGNGTIADPIGGNNLTCSTCKGKTACQNCKGSGKTLK